MSITTRYIGRVYDSRRHRQKGTASWRTSTTPMERRVAGLDCGSFEHRGEQKGGVAPSPRHAATTLVFSPNIGYCLCSYKSYRLYALNRSVCGDLRGL